MVEMRDDELAPRDPALFAFLSGGKIGSNLEFPMEKALTVKIVEAA